MADWKDTLNLPRTDFPMKANLQTAEPQALARWQEMGLVRAHPRARARPAEVRPARRPAVRQRADPHRHGDEQDPQGPGGEVADDDGLRRAVRARLRLPRPADRAESRSRARPEEARDVGRGLPPRLPRLRHPVHRRDERRVPAARRLRRLGPPLPDDGLQATRRRSSGRWAVRRAGAGLQGQEAGPLVHPLPHGAGRGGSRVRRPHVAVDLRRVPARAGERGASSRRACPALAGRDVRC